MNNTETPATETSLTQNIVELASETPVAAAAPVKEKKAVAKTGRKTAKKAAAKTATKAATKAATKKTAAKNGTKRTAGVKAQTQVDKHLSKWFDAQAKEKSTKEEKVRRADIIRQAVMKGAKSMGFKPPEA